MTQSHRHREESIDTQLAILLARHGVDAEPETIHQSGHQRPDVTFVLGGLRVIIEGKFSDTPDAENIVLKDALKRIQSGTCHLSVALVYPKALRTVPAADLEKTLATSALRSMIISETGQTEWVETTPQKSLPRSGACTTPLTSTADSATKS